MGAAGARNRGLRLGAAFEQPALDEQLIDASTDRQGAS
jgi:hypothetical protein